MHPIAGANVFQQNRARRLWEEGALP